MHNPVINPQGLLVRFQEGTLLFACSVLWCCGLFHLVGVLPIWVCLFLKESLFRGFKGIRIILEGLAKKHTPVLWIDELLHHLRNPGMMIPR